MTIRISVDQLRSLRMVSQRLLFLDDEAPETAVAVMDDIFCVQAQDLPAALLSFRPRSARLTERDVEHTLYGDRSIVRTWCLRGTLHILPAQDARWLVPLLGPRYIRLGQRRLRQLGWDEDRVAVGLRLLEKALAGNAMTRGEIVALLEQHSLPSEGQAPIHLLYRAAMEGILCYGPKKGNEQVFVHRDEWLGGLRPLSREEALAELTMRYLAAYGPAGPEDMVSWSGLPLTDARSAFDSIRDRIIEVEAGERVYWLAESRAHHLEEVAPTGHSAHLLPRFDTYMLGYRDRDLVVEPSYARKVHPGGGIIRSVLLVNGVAAATWSIRRKKSKLDVVVEPFADLPKNILPVVEAEAADVGRFLGKEGILS